MKRSKPAWWLLYALLPVAAVLLIAADIESPSGGWREFSEGMVSLAAIGAIALWVRANRAALALGGEQRDPREMNSTQEVDWRPRGVDADWTNDGEASFALTRFSRMKDAG